MLHQDLEAELAKAMLEESKAVRKRFKAIHAPEQADRRMNNRIGENTARHAIMRALMEGPRPRRELIALHPKANGASYALPRNGWVVQCGGVWSISSKGIAQMAKEGLLGK